MSNIISCYRKSRENQTFYLNRTPLSGVAGCVISYNLPNQPLKYLGMTSGSSINKGVLGGSLDINMPLIAADPFLQFTGISGFNGYLIEDKLNLNRNFSFTSGFITSYSNSCSVGAIPQVSVQAAIVGNIGAFYSNESPSVSGDLSYVVNNPSIALPIKIASYGSISLNLSEMATNRVLSYNLSLNIPRNAIYCLGTGTPVDVQINWPVTVELDTQFDVDNYLAQNARNLIHTPTKKDITLTLRDFSDNSVINTFSFSNMELISENINTSADQNSTIISVKYRSYIH